MNLRSFFKNNLIRIIIFTAACIAVALSVWSFNSDFDRILKCVEKSKEADIILKVVSYPTYDGAKSKMICEITDCPSGELIGTRTRLTLDNPDAAPVNYSDTLKLRATLTCADAGSMPGAFDYRNYLKSLNVASQCYAKYSDVTIAGGEGGFFSFIYSIRKNFIHNVDKVFPEKFAGLAKAVITGDRTGISEELSENLKIAGVYHIVAISGLHLNIFVCYVAFILSKLRMKKFRKAVLTYAVCTMCSIFVLIFTGYGVSVIRAFSMLIILFVSVIFSRDYNAKNALVVSAFAVLIFMPCNIYSTAFYLSFLSTLGVLISVDITNYLKERQLLTNESLTAFLQVVITSFSTIILTLPVTLLSFGYIPLLSWVANLIILPVMAPVLGSILIFAVAAGFGAWYIAYPASYAACGLSFVITELSGIIAQIPFAAPYIYPKDALTAGIIAILICSVIYIRRKLGIKPAICILVIFTLAFTGILKYNAVCGIMKVHFADVGQGDCAVIELPGSEALLIDCGNQADGEYLEDNIASFLRHRNIKKISAAFVSHFHSDHANGMFTLLKSGYVENLLLPAFADTDEAEAAQNKAALLTNAAAGGACVRFVKSGSEIRIGDAVLKVLLPDDDMYLKNNEMSSVIKLTYGENSFLFTGDIESKAIEHLDPQSADCDVLKVPHHGSKTGAIDSFYQKASPEYAVISCGKNNVYKHPSNETLSVINKFKIKSYRTDTDGTITFTANKTGILNIKTTG